MEEDDFYLKWEKHHNAFVSVFDSLYRHNILVDCILTAEERYLKAHRIVLMACSPYLEELLSQHVDNFPIVFLDIKFSELQAIVDFCYRGEVKLPQNELKGFIRAANTLRIKGLCSTDFKDEKPKKREHGGASVTNTAKRLKGPGDQVADKMQNESQVSESAKVPDINLAEGNGTSGCINVRESVDAGCAPVAKNDIIDLTSSVLDNFLLNNFDDSASIDKGSDNSDVDSDDSDSSDDEDMMERMQGAFNQGLFPWTCNRCGEAFTTRNLYTIHRRKCMDTTNHPWRCHKCPNSYKNKKDLVRHLIYCGNVVARLECERCGNSYKYERGLKRHQKYCGTDTKPLQCVECNKTYKYKRGLRRHQRRCGISSQIFPDSSTVSLDVKPEEIKEAPHDVPEEFYGNMAEPWSCHCGKVYKYRRSYLKHVDGCQGGNHVMGNPLDLKNITI